jgi:hypothetical protein
MASHCIASHCIASHRVVLHCIALHRVASHRITTHRIGSRCLAVRHIAIQSVVLQFPVFVLSCYSALFPFFSIQLPSPFSFQNLLTLISFLFTFPPSHSTRYCCEKHQRENAKLHSEVCSSSSSNNPNTITNKEIALIVSELYDISIKINDTGATDDGGANSEALDDILASVSSTEKEAILHQCIAYAVSGVRSAKHFECAQLLIQYVTEIDLNNTDNAGNTPVILCCLGGGSEGLLWLILTQSSPPNINAQNNAGLTAVMTACAMGSARCLKLLLRHNADAGINDNDGNSAADYALRNGHLDCHTIVTNAI